MFYFNEITQAKYGLIDIKPEEAEIIVMDVFAKERVNDAMAVSLYI